MKIKILVAVIAFGGLSSFSGFETNLKEYKNSSDETELSEGEKIMAKLDCATCHKIDKKVIGPSYLDIAKKYPLNDKSIGYLSDKIIKGGSGVWGAIPMAPHAALKKDDAKKVAKYILSLNNKKA
ncbi:c-type cytochrome [Flavobacterium gilvum]|uniref:Cytochrome C552 n=1 Tax=Flavobacterium gilvum TaxID=1492737 RepID=A0AAC9N426_9FLAO|nr:c-type cytochrome [Flavobacterium gilvum]AOW09955.1 cytochrome C552 [Flavobacterium gilvum]KFC59011.1 cytochrome C552 [Flavobacterium gilvum]